MGCFERDWSLAWIWDWVRIRGIGDRRSGWMGLGGGEDMDVDVDVE